MPLPELSFRRFGLDRFFYFDYGLGWCVRLFAFQLCLNRGPVVLVSLGIYNRFHFTDGFMGVEEVSHVVYWHNEVAYWSMLATGSERTRKSLEKLLGIRRLSSLVFCSAANFSAKSEVSIIALAWNRPSLLRNHCARLKLLASGYSTNRLTHTRFFLTIWYIKLNSCQCSQAESRLVRPIKCYSQRWYLCSMAGIWERLSYCQWSWQVRNPGRASSGCWIRAHWWAILRCIQISDWHCRF